MEFQLNDKSGRFAASGRLLSRREYNLTITLTIAWGFFLDYLLCKYCAGMITPYFSSTAGLIISIALYVIISIISIKMIHGSDNPVVSFMGFTLLAGVMGLVLSVVVACYTADSIFYAMLLTGVACAVIGVLSSLFPNFFVKMGRSMFVVLIITIIAEIALSFVYPAGLTVTSYVVIGIFSIYFGYDLVKAQAYAPTRDNAVDSAADIYIDVINLFVRILRIVGESKN